MKNAIGLVVAGLIAGGCGVDQVDELNVSDTTQGIGEGGCTDPKRCGVYNGGGVYTEEGGFAGAGSASTMITTFIGTFSLATGYPSGLDEVLARTFDLNNQPVLTKAPIPVATINGGPDVYRVLGIIENGDTKPQWWLSGPNGVIITAPSTTRSIQLIFGTGASQFTLSFRPADPQGSGLTTYDVVWNAGAYDPSTAQEYCFASDDTGLKPDPNKPDPVVFQKGLYVNPITGVTNANKVATTMSCLHGGIAVAKQWGYVYNGTAAQLTMFESALQMKRASYCGDEKFWTRKGTLIDILDTAGIHTTPLIPKYALEARWGRDPVTNHVRALCVDAVSPNHRRKSQAAWPPGTGTGSNNDVCVPGSIDNWGDCFTPTAALPTCSDGSVIPACATWTNPQNAQVQTLDAPTALMP